MQMTISYTNNGQVYTETFTENQAREELKDFGYPKAKTIGKAFLYGALYSVFNQ